MSKHYGYENRADKTLNLDFWLTVGCYADSRPSVRVTADYPKSIDRGEVTMNLKVKLPLALFSTPSIVAKIEVAAPRNPVEIDTTAVADAVKQAIGMDVDLRVMESIHEA
jgi:hypothetical protein